jgi:hypothetical protein
MISSEPFKHKQLDFIHHLNETNKLTCSYRNVITIVTK